MPRTEADQERIEQRSAGGASDTGPTFWQKLWAGLSRRPVPRAPSASSSSSVPDIGTADTGQSDAMDVSADAAAENGLTAEQEQIAALAAKTLSGTITPEEALQLTAHLGADSQIEGQPDNLFLQEWLLYQCNGNSEQAGLAYAQLLQSLKVVVEQNEPTEEDVEVQQNCIGWLDTQIAQIPTVEDVAANAAAMAGVIDTFFSNKTMLSPQLAGIGGLDTPEKQQKLIAVVQSLMVQAGVVDENNQPSPVAINELAASPSGQPVVIDPNTGAVTIYTNPLPGVANIFQSLTNQLVGQPHDISAIMAQYEPVFNQKPKEEELVEEGGGLEGLFDDSPWMKMILGALGISPTMLPTLLTGLLQKFLGGTGLSNMFNGLSGGGDTSPSQTRDAAAENKDSMAPNRQGRGGQPSSDSDVSYVSNARPQA